MPNMPLTVGEQAVVLSDMLANLLAMMDTEVVFRRADLAKGLWEVEIRFDDDEDHVIARAVRPAGYKNENEVLDLDHYLHQVVKENITDAT